MPQRRPPAGARRVFLAAVALSVGLLVGPSAFAQAQKTAVEVTDIVGRKVKVMAPVERVILGEGRQIYIAGLLDKEAPFRRIVGWRDDLLKTDPANYKAYKAIVPEIDKIPAFGGMKEGAFDVEQAVALKPDVILMNIEAKVAVDEAKMVEKIAALGIPVVYIDFREKPMEHTETSMRIMGKLFGKEAVAEEFIAFRAKSLANVAERLKAANLAEEKKPLVMIDRAPGLGGECCMSFGNENFGRMVEMAGGRNLAQKIIPGTFGTVNPEQIVASRPDVVIVTGSSWEAFDPKGGWVGVGAGADEAEARKKLAALMQRPPFAVSPAVKNGQAYAIWHQFYNSPYQFVAIEQIAKWLHPDLFKDVDPAATLATIHQKYLAIPYQPGYWVAVAK